MSWDLSFATLRRATLGRIPFFKNAKGGPAHREPDGSDWSPNDWCTATLGELGEAANILKKVRRGDFTMEEARPDLADELADAMIYLDMLAYQCQIDLALAVTEKWNRSSMKVGYPMRIFKDTIVHVDGIAVQD